MTLTQLGQLGIAIWGVNALFTTLFGIVVLYRAAIGINDLSSGHVTLRGLRALNYFLVTTFHIMLGICSIACSVAWIVTYLEIAHTFSDITGLPEWSLFWATTKIVVDLMFLMIVQFADQDVFHRMSLQRRFALLHVNMDVFAVILHVLSVVFLLFTIAQSAATIMIHRVVTHGVWSR